MGRDRDHAGRRALLQPVEKQIGQQERREIVEGEGALKAVSGDVESITIEGLVIDEREITTGLDWDYRVYGPGDAHYGSITVRSRVGKDSGELYEWWLEASQGKDIRKNISVIVLKRDGSEGRRYTVFDCFPNRWDPGEYLPSSSSVMTEEVTAQCERVEMQADGQRKDLLKWINDTVQGKPWKRNVQSRRY